MGRRYSGGSSGVGAVFAINTDGTGFTNLHSFTAPQASNPHTSSDGFEPTAGLILSGNTLFGTAPLGGQYGFGTVFSVNTDGSGFATLYNFTAASKLDPNEAYTSGLVWSGHTLYGTEYFGGSAGNGVVFGLLLPPAAPPELALALAGTNVVLTWPANSVAFNLQSAANLTSTNWSIVSPPPVLINGQNTVTNPISGAQMFYRLSQ